MTDLELLWKAAKAVGLNGRWNEPFQWIELDDASKSPGMPVRTVWNPLLDDGDAMRLAIKLDISLRQKFAMVQAEFPWIDEHFNERKVICEPVLDDHCASSRQVIVRAAAEIGGKKCNI